MLVEIFGDQGRHTRAAVGSNALPLGISVEIDAIVQLKQMTSPKSEFFFIDSLKKVKKDNWNHCISNDHPFLQYEFLLALEESKSACAQTGWKPHHYIEVNDK